MSDQPNTVKLDHRVQIIIPLFNAVEYTKQCVDTLKRNTHTNLFEVVFVDNGSTDGTKAFLKQLVQDDPEHFRVVTNDENKGFAGGVNAGLQAISSFNWEYACIANNDLLFTPNWLIQMLDCIQHATLPNVGAVGPVASFAGGSQGVQATYKTIPEIDNWAQTYHQMHSREWVEAGRIVGLCFLMSRKFFDTIGYLDERFVGGMWEDNDYCLRGKMKGFQFVVDRSTFLHHFGNKTFIENPNSLNASDMFHGNKKRYWAKWAEKDSEFEKLAEINAKARGVTDLDSIRLPDGRIKKWVVAACRCKDGAQYIGKVLERISEFADEIVLVVSKLTTDNTKEICAKFPKVVLCEDDTDDQPGAKEADSRNRVLELAYSRHPDWIWCFDHDEMPDHRIKDKIATLTNPKNPEVMLWTFPIIQLWNSENLRRADGLWGRFFQGRMFRALPGLRIDTPKNNLIHCGSHPRFSVESLGMSLIKIIHYGNINAEDRKRKYERYTKIDTDKDLNMILGMWKDYYWQLYYGQPTPQDKQGFNGQWRVLPDPKDWQRPPFGTFFDRDCYRHVHDELGMKLLPFGEHPTVTLAMLIHNEGNLLIGCLESVRHLVDEIVCIDTGCTDNTPEIAEQLGADVYEFKWNDNFSDARNFSLEKSTSDWILRLDPDEVLPPDSAIRIPEMIREPGVEAFIFPIMNWLEDPHQKQDANWALSETCRLFRNQYPTIKYEGLVHEELDNSFFRIRAERKEALLKQGLTEEQIAAKPLIDIRRAPTNLWHYGYLRGAPFLNQKFDYYCKLGTEAIKEDPNDARPYFTTAVHYLHIGDYKKAIENYHKTLELDPNHHMAANDVGVIYWTMGRLDKADEYFRRALASMNGQVHEYHKSRVNQNLAKVQNTLLSMLLLP